VKIDAQVASGPWSYLSRLMLVSIEADQSMMFQIGYGSNKKTRHLMPSGHKAFVVNNPRDVDLLLMHNKTFAAEYVFAFPQPTSLQS